MALHPNRYNRTSEAYDFTLFEGKEPEDKYTVHKHNLNPMYIVSKNSAAERERFGS